jgi:hypothetical protein
MNVAFAEAFGQVLRDSSSLKSLKKVVEFHETVESLPDYVAFEVFLDRESSSIQSEMRLHDLLLLVMYVLQLMKL